MNVPIYVGREASKRSGRYDTTAKEAPKDRVVTCLNGIPDMVLVAACLRFCYGSFMVIGKGFAVLDS